MTFRQWKKAPPAAVQLGVGCHSPAPDEAERARELDPLSSIINTWAGSRYYFARRDDLAVQQYRNAVELDPDFVPARLALGQAYEHTKMFQEAIGELERAAGLSGGSPLYIASLAHAYGCAGRRSDTLRLIDDLEKPASQRYVSSFDIAIAWLGLGDKGRALTLLERAIEDRSPRLLFLTVEPRFDPLRSHPRFQALVKRVGPN